MSTGKSVFGWIEGPVEFGSGAEDAPSSSSGLITQVPTKTWLVSAQSFGQKAMTQTTKKTT